MHRLVDRSYNTWFLAVYMSTHQKHTHVQTPIESTHVEWPAGGALCVHAKCYLSSDNYPQEKYMCETYCNMHFVNRLSEFIREFLLTLSSLFVEWVMSKQTLMQLRRVYIPTAFDILNSCSATNETTIVWWAILVQQIGKIWSIWLQ